MIPQELLGYKQWVLWRRAEVNGRSTKVPISPWSGKTAACDRPQTWSTFKHVRYAARRFACDGVGFVFTKADPFCGIDLDKCRKPGGSISAEARKVIDRIGSYAELSPSRTGAHILLKARLPGTERRKDKVEICDSGRYFTITGKHLLGTPLDIVDRQETLDQLTAELFSSPETPSFESASTSLIRNSLSAQSVQVVGTASADCGKATLRITETTTAEQTLLCATFSRSGRVVIATALTGYFTYRG